MTRVLVVDDHPDVVEALVEAIEDDPDLVVVGGFTTAESALREFTRLRPDVVVIDHGLPGLSGAQACRRLRQRDPSVQVVVLTSYVRDTVALTAFDAGAAAVVVKGSDAARIRRAVRTAASGGVHIDPLLARRIVELAVDEHAARTGARRSGVPEEERS